ncbi:hypothetical protein [Amycolatopsis silviterrae]|uniref:Uncharacterized protein n=1 Tax=Amycolatopsis silviterrae TaxID=1656914 RepID=A0ABW5H1D6_9PSEU
MTGMATPRGLASSASFGASTSPPATAALLGMVDRAKPNSRTRAGARRRPRAWAAPIARPAARIAVAGGLTLAGWLLGAALSQANAATDDQIDRPTASTHDPEPEHRYAGTATSGTLTWAMPGSATGAKHPHRFQFSARDFRPEVSFRPSTLSGSDTPDQHASEPAAKPAKTPEHAKPAKPKSKPKHHAPASDPETASQPGPISSSEPQHGLLDGLLGGSDRDPGQGLLGGLLGSPENDQPGLLDGILGTVDDTVDTTLHTTVTSVDTVIDTAPVRVVVPPSAEVEPAPAASGPVSVAAPSAKLVKEPAAPVVVKVSKQAPVVHPVSERVLTGQPAHETQPAPPVKQRSQAGGGGSGGGGEGLPSAPAAPAAPASTVSPGHDGSGGLRQLFALAGDGVTATQLKLIGVSRDHEVDGAGRDAALPTTSPD